MTRDSRTLCVVCAWRGDCAKRFNVESNGLHCADYSRDVTIPQTEQEPAAEPADKRGLPRWEDDEG